MRERAEVRGRPNQENLCAVRIVKNGAVSADEAERRPGLAAVGKQMRANVTCIFRYSMKPPSQGKMYYTVSSLVIRVVNYMLLSYY